MKCAVVRVGARGKVNSERVDVRKKVGALIGLTIGRGTAPIHVDKKLVRAEIFIRKIHDDIVSVNDSYRRVREIPTSCVSFEEDVLSRSMRYWQRSNWTRAQTSRKYY